jgi:hypothetical protein
MKVERNILNNLSRNLNKLLSYCLLILYFSALTLGYEILKLRDYVNGRFIDMKINNFHFCQWQFLNTTSAIENEVLQLNYQDTRKLDSNRIEIEEIFRNNFAYGSVYDEFCKKVHYCGVYYVIILYIFINYI